MVKKPDRDIEQERLELLRIMDENISNETRDAIDIALASVKLTKCQEVITSNHGAVDADIQ